MNLNILFICVLVVLTVAQSQSQQTALKDDVIVLDNTNLQSSIYGSEEPWLLDLYAPWCGHCINMSGQWAKLATKMKGILNVAKIDASQYPQFNEMFDLKGFPHIVFIPGGKKDKSLYYIYTGPRTAEAFQRWTMEKIDQNKRSILQRLVDQNKWQQICLGPHSDFCTIFFLPSIVNSSEDQRDFYLKIINGLIKRLSRSPVSWLWAQEGDHKGLQRQLGLQTTFPSVVLINPSGRRFSVMQNTLTEDDFTEWMKNVWDIDFKSYQGELDFSNDSRQNSSKESMQETNQL